VRVFLIFLFWYYLVRACVAGSRKPCCSPDLALLRYPGKAATQTTLRCRWHCHTGERHHERRHLLHAQEHASLWHCWAVPPPCLRSPIFCFPNYLIALFFQCGTVGAMSCWFQFLYGEEDVQYEKWKLNEMMPSEKC